MNIKLCNKISKDPLNWLSLHKDDSGVPRREANRQRLTARALLLRLYKRNAPGVILADEVGMGKTFEALSVMAALLLHKPKANVLILASSRPMAKAWQERWHRLLDYKIVDSGVKKILVKNRWMSEAYTPGDLTENKGITIASFSSVKRNSQDDAPRIFLLRQALGYIYHRYGLRLKEHEKKYLFNAVFPGRKISATLHCEIKDLSYQEAEKIIGPENFYKDGKIWVSGAEIRIREVLRQLELSKFIKKGKTKAFYDLVIIDEAHKTRAKGSSRVTNHLLAEKWEKMLYVTATPFSLAIGELKILLEGFTKSMHPGEFNKEMASLFAMLDAYRDSLQNNNENFSEIRDLQGLLRKFIVRSTKAENHNQGRSMREIYTDPAMAREYARQMEALGKKPFPMLALEKMLDIAISKGGREHQASRRQSLCSSMAAINKSFKVSPLAKGAMRKNPALLKYQRLIQQKNNGGEIPKFKVVFKWILSQVREHEKVVVFCTRQETITKLIKWINTSDEARELIKISKRCQAYISKNKQHFYKTAIHSIGRMCIDNKEYRDIIYKLFAYSRGSAEMYRNRRMDLRHAKHHLAKWLSEPWNKEILRDFVQNESSFGDIKAKSHLPIAAEFDEVNMLKFNLPSYPLILVSGEKGSEAIDLHKYCRKLLHYDLHWSPAVIEQRHGRIDRINSYAQYLEGGVGKAGKEDCGIEIYFCPFPGTYERKIFQRVQARHRMFRYLLGAGEWLDLENDEEMDPDAAPPFDDDKVEKYRINLAPFSQSPEN
ncbi:MAG: hypothetical protein A2089_03765 [Elusimicrobia bacterium GWD2_63_28]|nr:MAG: hypothetical protein A2089_03765 [Elusimicrobia bacterium GWD2_63_28]